MSATTTANVQTVLRDYDLQHSEDVPSEYDASLNRQPPSNTEHETPASWPSEYRRIPAYRPVDPDHDQSTRRVYPNPVVRIFVGMMFTGVFVEATVSKAWRLTGGRFWNVGYKIGGEW